MVLGGLVLGCTVAAPLFNIAPLTQAMGITFAAIGIVDVVAFQLLFNAFDRLHKTSQAKAA